MSEINLNDMKPRAGRNPFTVPDGYFDHFADEFVAKLSEQPQVVVTHASTTADTFDQMTDYAMYDKGDMYASLYDY